VLTYRIREGDCIQKVSDKYREISVCYVKDLNLTRLQLRTRSFVPPPPTSTTTGVEREAVVEKILETEVLVRILKSSGPPHFTGCSPIPILPPRIACGASSTHFFLSGYTLHRHHSGGTPHTWEVLSILALPRLSMRMPQVYDL